MLKNKLVGLVKEEEGQGLTEYGLVLGIIAVAVVAVIVSLKDVVLEMFTNTRDGIVDETGIDGVIE